MHTQVPFVLMLPLVLGFRAHICHYGDDGFTGASHLTLRWSERREGRVEMKADNSAGFI